MALPDCSEEELQAGRAAGPGVGPTLRRLPDRHPTAAAPVTLHTPPIPCPQALYEWVDSVPLSRPKRNITRDFADGGTPACGGSARRPLLPAHCRRQPPHHATPRHHLPFPRAVLTAEIVHHYFPKLVELHNYSPAHNSVQKMYNWQTLNQKVSDGCCRGELWWWMGLVACAQAALERRAAAYSCHHITL